MRKRIPSCIFHIRQAAALLLPAAVLMFVLSSPLLQAQFLVKPVNLAYLAQRADIILQGQVTEVLHEALPGYPNISTTKVTLSVQRMLRGPEGSTYTFREIAFGQRPKGGKMNYGVGQQLLLFLPSPSQYGLSLPIGLEQGRFHIGRGSTGTLMVVNEISNEGLFTNVQEETRMAGRTLTKSQSRITATRRGPVQLDGFISLVNSLMLLPRIR